MNRLIFSVILLLLPILSQAQSVKTHIPEQAYAHLPALKEEVERLHPNGPEPAYHAALIEHESCISLKHSRCWSSTSRLKTSREEGAGLAQITRAWHKDGSVRFDKLKEMSEEYKEELGDLTWSNVYDRADLQLKVVVLLTRENWNRLHTVKNYTERLSMTDSAYNGGLGAVLKARRICGLKEGCDPQIWSGNVANVIPKSNKVLYGNRSPRQINLDHVFDVVHVRRPKYQRYFLINEYLNKKKPGHEKAL